MVRFWLDAKDIKLTILETLPHFSRREDLMGWIRPAEQVDAPALADEIARLSRENSELREKISRLDKIDTELISGISFQSMKAGLEKVFVARINPNTETEEGNFNINLLQYLLEKRNLFSMGYTPGNYEEEVICAELVSRGLLESYAIPKPENKVLGSFHWKARGYKVTSACCVFLNKLDHETPGYPMPKNCID